MRDIGRRIRRYRLSRYVIPGAAPRRPPRWLWLLAALWLAWVGLFSDHSLWRIWRLREESTRVRRELEQLRREIARLDEELRDPRARLREAERALRRDGFARPDEVIYRIEPERPDSLRR